MNISGLRVVNFKGLITAVLIGMINKVAVKRKNIIHQAQGKFLDILFIPLAINKFLPCLKKIF